VRGCYRPVLKRVTCRCTELSSLFCYWRSALCW